jgi:hypothetical protein
MEKHLLILWKEETDKFYSKQTLEDTSNRSEVNSRGQSPIINKPFISASSVLEQAGQVKRSQTLEDDYQKSPSNITMQSHSL